MATVTHEIGLATTSAGPQTTAAFTPAAGDLLVVFAFGAGTVDATPTLTSSAGLTFTKVTSAISTVGANGGTLYLFVANALAAASSQTVTFNTPNDVNTGCIVYVAGVAGMVRTGLAAVRQSAIQNTGTAGTTPAPAFGVAPLTANPCVGSVVNATNPSAMTQPGSWTEGTADLGFATPTSGGEYAFRNSGQTATTITWGSTSASIFGAVIAELDSSVLPLVNLNKTPEPYSREIFRLPISQLITVFTPVVAGFTELFTDSVGLTDTSTVEVAKLVTQTDSVGLTDTVVFTQANVVTDSVGLTDAALLTRSLVYTDSTGLTDTSTVEAAKLVTQTDSAGLTDAAAFTQGKGFTDSAGLTDAAALARSLVYTDSAGLTDTSTVQAAKLVTQTDDAGLTDAGLILDVEQDFTDSAGLIDSALLTRLLGYTDSTGLTDTTSISSGKILDVTDTIGLTDTTAFVQSEVITDSTGLTDTAQVSGTTTYTDSVGLTDTTAFIQSDVITDSTGLTDVTQVAAGKLLDITDSVGLTDTRVFNQAKVHTDSAGLTDAAALIVSKVFTDSAGLTDTSLVDLQKNVTPTDSVGLTDTQVFARALGVTDSAGLIDTAAFTNLRVHTDSVGLTDTSEVLLVIPLVYGLGAAGNRTAASGRSGQQIVGSGVGGRG